MSVDGVGKSAIARIKRIARNTASRWLALAAAFARRFNNRMLRRVDLRELQADEARSFLLHKQMEVWIHTLKFGKERRTPAWQAGLVSHQLTFREIFLHPLAMLLLLLVYAHVAVRVSDRMRLNRRATTVA